jgi:ABC-type multidrug transport system ATPase subunit
MTLLNSVARAGNVVIFTIHQPAYSVFAEFTNVFLLKSGKLMYYGLTSDTPQDFAKLGYPVPVNTNPADWILVRITIAAMPSFF